MEGEVNAVECLVCGRELGVSRWVRGANLLRHSGRAVAEAVVEVLGCGEAAAGLSRLCFRCYRLLLGLDYHTHQRERQRVALIRLYQERENKETQTTRGNSSGTGEKLSGTVGRERENTETQTTRGILSVTGEKFSGTGEKLTSTGEKLTGSVENLSGTGENLSGTVSQERVITETQTRGGNLTGIRENLSGTGEKLSGTVGQERENMETQARGENSSVTCTVNPCGMVNPCGTVDPCYAVDPHGTVGHERGNTEKQTRGENSLGTCTLNPCGAVNPCGTVGHERENMETQTRGESSLGTGTVNPCSMTPGEALQQTDSTSRGNGVHVLPGSSPQQEGLAMVSGRKVALKGHMDRDTAEMIDIDDRHGGGVGLYGTPQTDSVVAVRAKEALEDCHTAVAVGPQGQELDVAPDADYSKCSYDHEYHKNSAVIPVEGCDLPIITAGGHQEQHRTRSLAAKRRKTAKKWDDFDYYEDESKTIEVEGCDGADHPMPAQHFQLPLRTGKKKCRECKEEFSTKKAILSHRCHQTKRKEREKVTYTCKGCLRRFLLRREYLKHADVCYKNTPVTCSLCLVKLPSAAYLPRHLAALHQVKPPLSKSSILCEACGRGFSRKESLERHEARVHGKAHGSHQCPLCGRTFPHTSLLAEHLRAHQGYTCPECYKVFSCRSNLTLHRRAHHMRKAAYHCTACNKHWKFHASYTYHMKKFHGSSEQRCGGCRLVVCSAEALRQHSLTCGVHHTQSTGQEAALEDMQGGDRELMKPLSNSAPGCGSLLNPAHLSKKGSDSLVLLSEMRKMQVYPPPNTSHPAPPAGEIIVEVLEDTDADYQYIILVEDAAVAHFTMADTSAIWNTSGHQ